MPVKGVRKATAAAMVNSAFTAPHVTEFLQVDVTETMELLAELKASREFRDVKLVQTALLVEEVEKIAQNFAKYPPRLPPAQSAVSSANTPSAGENNSSSRPPPSYTDGYKIPVIICGDYNSIPQSGVYEFLSSGYIPPDHEDFMSHTYGKYTTEGLRHRLGLKSAYAGLGELPMTNYTPSFKGAIDYIWYSASNLSVNSVLGEVDPGYLDKVVGFPNAHYPSEYVASIFFVW